MWAPFYIACNRDVSTTMMIGVLRLVAGFLSSV
jgi:hypothetical protein